MTVRTALPVVRTADTHCPYCALQCGMRLEEDTEGTVTASPRGGGMCKKGWTAPELLDHPKRLTTPLLHGEPVSWETALDHVADRIRAVQAAHGKDAVGVFGGGGLTNEKVYQLGKWTRLALGSKHIDYNGRFCMSSAAGALNRSFGVDRGLPFPKDDLKDADVVVLVGANPAETMPPLMRFLANAELIVVDPRRTATAEQAQLHLQPAPGTDLALANGLLHIAIEQGYLDHDYIDAHTTGFDEVRQTAAGYWPAFVERITGVSVPDLYAAARLMAGPIDDPQGSPRPKKTVILTARGSEQHAKGVDTVTAWINLALALGLPGKPSSGYGCITGQGNGQGGREHGQKADQLPGYRSITDPAAREHVAKVWGVAPETLPGAGVSAVELLRKCGDDVKMLFVLGSNPIVSAPRAARVADRLKALDCLVSFDFVLSETAQLAEVVLPVTQWAEEDGTMTDLEGRIIRRRSLRDAPDGVHSDLWIMKELADRLDAPGAYSTDPASIFEELGRASAGGKADYSGVSYERLEARTFQWPVPSPDHDGTPRMFADFTFNTPDGKAKFVAVDHRHPAERRDNVYPLYLTTGRVLTQYQSGAQTRLIESLGGTPDSEQFLQIHPDTAVRHGIGEGDWVRITSRRGSYTAPARLTADIRPDTVFSPFHFPGAANANAAVSDVLDPISRMPEFKVCAVKIAPAARP
ncbi:molybdopterin oxidoreductase family protein [Glycomyces sp. TRM65418]|uniref:molybdopterin oxidoreductase family protein n=1 Tax=Glycomyces sp. TRM65418 TaxID=2867006 RepID=UPI001CE5ED19|nr:molybdopterin oxidoreductase family protein [Glycomyces sp. TRM65418]MCC3762378.1 molybdopterin oxidoreductase family protein [Glycomyces sp. TRM65418]QZD56426.1 molybdopterin oxidoreductase family protein [Glycomyces sp. TRM65418]